MKIKYLMRLICTVAAMCTSYFCLAQEEYDYVEDVVVESPTLWGGVKETKPIHYSCLELEDLEEQYRCTQECILKFVMEHLTYPDDAKKLKIEGRVYLNLHINKSGEVAEITVVKSVYKSLDATAIEVLKLLPDFIPATQRGAPVECSLIIPVTYKLRK